MKPREVVSSARPRVVMIGPFPRAPNRINGGVAAALMYLSDSLSAGGEVDLRGVRIARDKRDRCDAARFGFPISDLFLGRLSMTTFYTRQLRILRELVEHYDADLVHAQGTDVSGFLAVRCAVPAVVTVHGLLAECARYQTDVTSRVRATLSAALTERSTVRKAQNVIAISPFVRQYYRNVIRGNVFDIPNAVSASFFDVQRRPESGRILYAGRIANGKGLSDLVEAVSRLPSHRISVALAGATPDPSYERTLRLEIERLGLAGRIEFLGLLDERALLDQFARACVLILPSYQETAPMVVQQAMAAGLPVIASRVGGIPDQLEHMVTGVTFVAGQVEQLAACIGSMLDDPEGAARISANARAKAELQFRPEAVARATLGVYRQLLNRKNAEAA